MGVNEELNEKYRTILKAFYSVIKTCDQYIRFAFLTGVTKFSKVSIFSDLNNLLPAYADVPFGQTGIWIGRFVQDIRTKNVDGFMERLQSLISSIPYDTFTEEKLETFSHY